MQLFYAPGACSMAAHIVLEELKQSYQAVRVDFKTHTIANGEDYYKINPLGSVPALKLDDGNIITQNIAILTYLGELDPKHHLIPKCGSFERTRCNEWLALCSTDLHKAFGPLFKPDHFVSSDGAKAELKQHVEANVKSMMGFVDKKLSSEHYALGEYFSVVDAYLFVFSRWVSHLKMPMVSWPNYAALAQRVEARAAVQQVLQQEGQ